MERFRRQPPAFWVLLISLLIFGALMVANLILGWGQNWIQLVAVLLALANSAYSMRRLWKQSDPNLLHRADSTTDRDS